MKWLAASCRELLGLGNMDIVDDSYMLRLVACPFFFFIWCTWKTLILQLEGYWYLRLEIYLDYPKLSLITTKLMISILPNRRDIFYIDIGREDVCLHLII